MGSVEVCLHAGDLESVNPRGLHTHTHPPYPYLQDPRIVLRRELGALQRLQRTRIELLEKGCREVMDGRQEEGRITSHPSASLPWVAGARLWVLRALPSCQEQTSAPFSQCSFAVHVIRTWCDYAFSPPTVDCVYVHGCTCMGV